MSRQLSERTRLRLTSGSYAFIDAGCASGGSIDHCERRFGRRPGLGLDWFGGDLDVARSHGHAVEECDLLSVDIPPACVGFTSMMDFLEHLPDEAAARRVVETFARASRQFLFIRHPSFDDIDYLARRGLKFTWTHWSGHTNMMRIDDFRRMFDDLGWRDYTIFPDLPVSDSSHPAIVPLNAPIDTLEYDPVAHGPKPAIAFERVLYGKYDIFVRLSSDLGDAEWRRIATTEGWRPIWVSPSASNPPAGDDPPVPSIATGDPAGRCWETLEPLLARASRSRPQPSPVERQRLDDILGLCARRASSLVHLIHLLDAFNRAVDVRRVFAGGDVGVEHAGVLRARFPDLQIETVPEAIDGSVRVRRPEHDFAFWIDGDGAGPSADRRARLELLAGMVRPGGWFYSAGSWPDHQRGSEDAAVDGWSIDDCDLLLAASVLDRRLLDPLAGLVTVLDTAVKQTVAPDLIRLAMLDLQPPLSTTRATAAGIKVLCRRRSEHGELPDA